MSSILKKIGDLRPLVDPVTQAVFRDVAVILFLLAIAATAIAAAIFYIRPNIIYGSIIAFVIGLPIFMAFFTRTK